jgi:hypothetical protein
MCDPTKPSYSQSPPMYSGILQNYLSTEVKGEYIEEDWETIKEESVAEQSSYLQSMSPIYRNAPSIFIAPNKQSRQPSSQFLTPPSHPYPTCPSSTPPHPSMVFTHLPPLPPLQPLHYSHTGECPTTRYNTAKKPRPANNLQPHKPVSVLNMQTQPSVQLQGLLTSTYQPAQKQHKISKESKAIPSTKQKDYKRDNLNKQVKTKEPPMNRHPSEREDTTNPEKATIDCPVCGDLAIAHFHYGGMCCYSCKAFFRRVVNTLKVRFRRERENRYCKSSSNHIYYSGQQAQVQIRNLAV